MAARELFIVLVLVIGALLVLLPLLFQSQVRARRRMCEYRQIEVAKALLRFEERHEAFPGYRNETGRAANGDSSPVGWVRPILPYLGFDDKHQKPGRWAARLEDTASPTGDSNRAASPAFYIADLVCPESPPRVGEKRGGWNSFVVNAGMPDATGGESYPRDWPANGIFQDLTDPRALRTSLAYLDAHDGAERTILLTENTDAGLWTEVLEHRIGYVWIARVSGGVPDPGDQLHRINVDRLRGDGSLAFARPASFHTGGVNVAMASGATQFLVQTIDYLVFVQLTTPDDRGLKVPGSDRPVDAPFRTE